MKAKMLHLSMTANEESWEKRWPEWEQDNLLQFPVTSEPITRSVTLSRHRLFSKCWRTRSWTSTDPTEPELEFSRCRTLKSELLSMTSLTTQPTIPEVIHKGWVRDMGWKRTELQTWWEEPFINPQARCSSPTPFPETHPTPLTYSCVNSRLPCSSPSGGCPASACLLHLGAFPCCMSIPTSCILTALACCEDSCSAVITFYRLESLWQEPCLCIWIHWSITLRFTSELPDVTDFMELGQVSSQICRTFIKCRVKCQALIIACECYDGESKGVHENYLAWTCECYTILFWRQSPPGEREAVSPDLMKHPNNPAGTDNTHVNMSHKIWASLLLHTFLVRYYLSGSG